MSKKLFTKLLAFALCAAMVMQPVTSLAAEEPEGDELILNDGQTEGDEGVTRIEDGILTIVPFEGAVKYTIYAGYARYQTVETTVDLVKMCYDLDLAFGEYDLSITHWDQNYHMINRPQHVMFTYDKLPPEGIHQVTHVKGGSTNLPKYLMCGNTLPVTGFVFGDFLDIQVIEWQKKINGEFVYVGPNGGAHVVSSGEYKVLVKVSLAEGYEYTHELGNELTMVEEFGGEEWTSVDVERYANGKIKSATFLSPSYYPMGDDPIILPEIENVQLEGDILSWDPFEGAICYFVSIGENGITVENNYVNLADACSMLGHDSGDYSVYVVGFDEYENAICEGPEFLYSYTKKPEPEEGLFFVDAVTATSNIAWLASVRSYSEPGFDTDSDRVRFESIWERYDGSEWEDMGGCGKEALPLGHYRLKTTLSMRSDYDKGRFGKDITFTVDGEEWTRGECSYDEGGHITDVTFISPEFDVKDDEPIEPLDPDNIEGGTWYEKYGATYYDTEDGEPLEGLKKIDGENYYFNKSGAIKKNTFVNVDGKKLYFGNDGKMLKNTFKTLYGATYYFGEDGAQQYGLTAIEDKNYFFKPSTGAMVKSDFVNIADDTYYFDSNGQMVNGFMTKWGATYYFGEDGKMATGFAETEIGTCFFRENGAQIKDQFISSDGHTFYLKEDGTMAKGETITRWSVMHQFDEDGHLVRSGRW
jgi:hypothetical protein